MTVVDTSVIIDYLAGVDDVVRWVDRQESLLTSSVCVYEVLEGEVFGPGRTDIYQARQEFSRVQSLEFNETLAMEAARLQSELQAEGETLAARDVMVAATARSTGDMLAVADSDFQTEPLEGLIDVVNLRD
ncbi:VapC toxin family PIN domain ribonuclease [Halobacteriales archaeon QH_8_68_33]|nr:MAG: VapC toxin family PIN domain ribonuclease [Halobacteriales archaeon QH_1_68_42]PSP91308.1 MAG: VapC toxin family PIN domain ribonuclease [Halobacteriales archaeon QH_8_68_33]